MITVGDRKLTERKAAGEALIALARKLKPKKSELEAALSRFEVELVEERRTVAEVSGWLPGFKARLGDPFPHQAELDEKRAEMAELEASLAATPGDAAPPEATEAAA